MLNGPIRNLGPNQDIGERGQGKKPGHPVQSSLAIEGDFTQALLNTTSTQIQTQRNQS